jgi:hypothetical protein
MRRVLCLGFVAVVVGCSYDWSIGGSDVAATSQPPPAPITDAGPTTDAKPTPEAGTLNPDTGTRDGGINFTECGADCECQNSATCNFSCAKGECNIECSDRSTCTIKCARGARCTMLCREGAKCNLDCSAGGSTCPLTCRDEATCNGKCSNGSVCPLTCAQRCNMDCAGGLCPPAL